MEYNTASLTRISRTLFAVQTHRPGPAQLCVSGRVTEVPPPSIVRQRGHRTWCPALDTCAEPLSVVSELRKWRGATSQITREGERPVCLVNHLPPASWVSKWVNSVLPLCLHSFKSDSCWILSESQVASLLLFLCFFCFFSHHPWWMGWRPFL